MGELRRAVIKVFKQDQAPPGTEQVGPGAETGEEKSGDAEAGTPKEGNQEKQEKQTR